jgi:hypothetical protein
MPWLRFSITTVSPADGLFVVLFVTVPVRGSPAARRGRTPHKPVSKSRDKRWGIERETERNRFMSLLRFYGIP